MPGWRCDFIYASDPMQAGAILELYKYPNATSGKRRGREKQTGHLKKKHSPELQEFLYLYYFNFLTA